MIYFDSRKLSDCLGIGLAKWKRWVREFLPPDPLGGLQSGYARQFNYKDAFRVFLGGCLVAELKFSIPEAKIILSDLNTWLKRTGFFHLQPPNGQETVSDKVYYRLYIFKTCPNRFSYTIRNVKKVNRLYDENSNQDCEIYSLDFKNEDIDLLSAEKFETGRVLSIGALYRRFLSGLRQQGTE